MLLLIKVYSKYLENVFGQFGNWIKYKVKQGDFKDGIHFFTNLLKTSSDKGGRPKMEYLLTTNTAKHICMMEGTDRGRQIRLYFIECEKRLNETVTAGAEIGVPMGIPRNLHEALELQRQLVESFLSAAKKNEGLRVESEREMRSSKRLQQGHRRLRF